MSIYVIKDIFPAKEVFACRICKGVKMRSTAKFYKTFALTMGFFILIFALFNSNWSPWRHAGNGDWQAEAIQIDGEITLFEQLRDDYLMRVSDHEGQALSSDTILWAKRQTKLAIQNKRMAASMQKDILSLQARRDKLLKKQKRLITEE